jgi:hypothetical protein
MSTIKVQKIQSSSGTQEVSQTTLFSGTAKAWAHLNGTGTIAERDSFNISSHDDDGVGYYTHNLSSAMSAQYNGSSTGSNWTLASQHNVTILSATSELNSYIYDQVVGSVNDDAFVQNTLHGDLA